MSTHYGPAQDTKAVIALIWAVVDRGDTFFDTAEACRPLTSEELVVGTRAGRDHL